MFLVCVCHAANGTGLMPAQDGAINRALTLLITIFGTIGVNLFVLISGYCCVELEHKVERYFKLWLQAVFFTLLYLPFAIAAGYYRDPSALVAELLPVPLAGNYWFFTAYTGLFILMPYLNCFVTKLSRTQQYSLFITLFFLFCILNHSNTTEIAATGYNVIWMAALYLMGGILKLNPPKWSDISLLITATIGLAGQTGCIIAASILKHTDFPLSILPSGYTSPFLTILSIATFLLIARTDMQNWKISRMITFLSPLMFGVYLAHMDSYVFSTILVPFIRKIFITNGHASWWAIPLAGTIIFSGGCILAWLQLQLFKVFRVQLLTRRLAQLWDRLSRKLRNALFHC